MRAVALNHKTRELEEREIAEPEIRCETEVLFRVREIGICGTDRDLASFRLEFPPPPEMYLVLGHECVGEVTRAGPGVKGLQPGDIVVPIVRRPCRPSCAWCTLGRRDLCGSGHYAERGIVGAHGYFTEAAIDDESDLVRIPPQLQEHAVLVEPLSVVEKAVGNALRLHPGQAETVLVIGAGPIGLLTAMACRARELAVTVLSREAETSDRARLAQETGARYLTQTSESFDVVIEAAGASEAAAIALKRLGRNGVLVFLGAAGPVEIPTLDLILKNQVVVGSVNAAPADFERAVADLGRLPAGVLRAMVARERFSAHRSTLLGPLRPTPKIVHSLE